MLTLAAALTVANVVRLALYARRDEIEIMQLVGAPQAYIRGPFVMEGVLQGGVGALVALAALAVAFFALRGALPRAARRRPLNLSSIRFLPAELCVCCWSLGGMAVGCLGGLVAAWRPLTLARGLRNLDTRFRAALHWRRSTDNSSRGPACHAS